MNFEEERQKLFDEVWKEPMTTVAKRYEISDNGLRKRCVKLEIPLPPAGYWAKLQAGKSVPAQPELPPYKALFIHKQAGVSIDTDKKPGLKLELIDITENTSEQLQELEGLGLLSPESKERFLSWCKKIEVPKRVAQYNQLIINYQEEMEYRKKRDEVHRFHDKFSFSLNYTLDNTKIKYRDNKAVLPIYVSNKQANRAYRLVEALIKSVEELGGNVTVGSGVKDNASFKLFGYNFSFQLFEIMVKRRTLLSSQPDNYPTDFKPMYEKVFSGRFEIEFEEVLDPWQKVKTPKGVKFVDSDDNPIEKQIGDIFIALCKMANESFMADLKHERERELMEIERKRLQAIEEEKRKRVQQTEEQKRRRNHLMENIEQQMESWFMSQRLRKYAEELEVYALATDNETNKELLLSYIDLVHRKAKNCDPVTDILNEVKAIVTKRLTYTQFVEHTDVGQITTVEGFKDE